MTSDPAPTDASFASTFDAFLADLFERFPVAATAIGEHRYDDRWGDLSEVGRQDRLAAAERWRSAFLGLDDLSADDAIDRDLVVGELDAAIFEDTVLREDAWDPLSWIYLVGEGLFTLLARDFAPLAARLASVAGRLERLPPVLDAAREALVGVPPIQDADGTIPARPVSRFHTETATRQLAGVVDLIDEALAALDAAGDDADVRALEPRLRAAADAARTALAAFEGHLRDVVLPAAEGEGRLGPQMFARKMRHTMRSEVLTPERILGAAETEAVAVRAEMVRLARALWPAWCGGPAGTDPAPDDEQALVRSVLDAIAAEHPPAEALLDWCLDETARIEAFCEAEDVIGRTEEPLDIRWTPVFLRSFGGAMLSSPGPLDRGQKAFFAITPIPEDWTDEQRESYQREDNARMLRLLCIHEAVPGHYLQGVHANRSPSLARAVFGSGLFAEGWAVYVTQVMMDVGYGADDPALLLTHWKFYLRSLTNAVIDARIHTAGMTEAEAVGYMVDVGFQEEAEARAKFDRARLTSTQLSTYFTGSFEMWDIELAVRRRLADDPTLSPPRALPGGYGETPGFVYRRHLESVIAHGSPPTSLLRRILLD